MPKRVSTARGREFGACVRAAIAAAGLTSRAAAEILNWDEAKVSDVVNGKGGVSEVEVALLLGVCRVRATEVARLLKLYGGMDVRGWWQQHGTCTPILPRTVVEHLKLAETLTVWHTHAVPLFLQTADYMLEVLIASSTSPADELQERIEAQLAMQGLLRRDVRCTIYVHELALRLPIGSDEVQAEQLLHLMFMANRPNMAIRIVPAARGAHAGMAGPFTRLSFAKYEPMVWVETENSSLFFERADAINGYEKVIGSLDAGALDEIESKALVFQQYDTLRAARG